MVNIYIRGEYLLRRGLFSLPAALAGLVLTASASAQVNPGALESYKDWTIGCDNVGRCEAVSLHPIGAVPQDRPMMISVVRDIPHDAEVEVRLRKQGKAQPKTPVVFSIDGRQVASATDNGETLSVSGPQGAALALAMARGNAMEIRQGGQVIGRPSLTGSAAALRYMDARQGRAGTVTALVATGPLRAQAVRKPPMLPIVRRAAVPDGKAAALWREERGRAALLAGCKEDVDGKREAELHPLSGSQSLVLLPCGSGAYNLSTVPLIATGMPGRRIFAMARFDHSPGWTQDPSRPLLVNASWNAQGSELKSHAKGRGVGDCGSSESYVWDGAQFRLALAKAMGECRGAWEWITTWRATVVE